MTSFVNPYHSKSHLGVAGIEVAMAQVRQLGARFKGAKGAVSMLLAGAVAACVVVADQVISSWTDGHLLMAWIALWTLVFVAVMLFAEATRGVSARLIARLDAWLLARAQRASDERIWAVAQSDPRFMADLQAARLRTEGAALAAGEPLPAWPFSNMPYHRPEPYKAFQAVQGGHLTGHIVTSRL